MRRDHVRLRDILEALDSLPRVIGGRTEPEFLADETVCYAIAQRLTVVGEAAARLSPDLRQRFPAMPWADIVAFRNILVHEYFGIHWPIVWLTATVQAPELRRQVAEILRTEFPE
jgi:uncharacterized protein with HEPN domain